MKHITIAFCMLSLSLCAQDRLGTRTGQITFHSSTPLEEIEANNRKVTAVFDATTGAIEFAVLIKAFEFEKALMQEHFNENYMESNTFPKAVFKGTVSGFTPEQARVAGSYSVVVSGDLTIHGVSKKTTADGTFTVKDNGMVEAASSFIVRPEDHGIAIPGVVRKNIAEQVEVKVDLELKKL